jgi:hypothetical protein
MRRRGCPTKLQHTDKKLMLVVMAVTVASPSMGNPHLELPSLGTQRYQPPTISGHYPKRVTEEGG